MRFNFEFYLHLRTLSHADYYVTADRHTASCTCPVYSSLIKILSEQATSCFAEAGSSASLRRQATSAAVGYKVRPYKRPRHMLSFRGAHLVIAITAESGCLVDKGATCLEADVLSVANGRLWITKVNLNTSLLQGLSML